MFSLGQLSYVSEVDHLSVLDLNSKPTFTRLTGIVCTIG